MIEQAMYFALGFCAAALIALAILPAFWDRAMRLTRRRLEAQMAMSPEQITAARDQLRAEFAVKQRRTELQLEAALGQRHANLVEIGRRTAAMRALEDRVSDGQSEIATLQETIAAEITASQALRAELTDLRGEHAKLLDDHGALGERHGNLSAELDSINTVASERHAELLSVETLIAGLRARARDLETMLATSRNEVSARTKALRVLEATHRAFELEATDTASRLQDVEARFEALQADHTVQSGAMTELRAKFAEAEARLQEAVATETEVSRALSAESKRAEALDIRLAKQGENAKKVSDDLMDTVDRLRSEKNLAEGALEKARAERGRLQTELRALKPANDTPSSPQHHMEPVQQRALPAGE